jgi:hypothetical protein
MKARSNRPILDRACDALRIPDERRHKLRIAAAAMGLSEDDPSHVYLVVGEVVTMGLAANQAFMTALPSELRAAADNAVGTVETRLDATITRAATKTGEQVRASVGAAMESFVQRESRRSWPLLAAGLGIAMLLSVALGWALADRDQLSGSVFWSDLMDGAQADGWQRIIELNPTFPRAYATCSADSARVYSQDGGLACRTAVWLRTPTEAGLPPLQQFLRNPALMLGSSVYILLGALGCLLGAASMAILFWWWERR